MRAVIVDLKGKHAAALDENGSIIRIRNNNYSIGQTIQMQEVNRSRTPSLKRMGTVAAAAVLILAIGTGTAYATPYGTVSLDADSSIEYTINRFDHVLKVKALNEEGEALLSAVDESTLRLRPVEQAITETLEKQELAPGEVDSIQITTETKSERHTERLQEHLMNRIPKDETHLLPNEMPEQGGRPGSSESGFPDENQPVPDERHELPHHETFPDESEEEQGRFTQNMRPSGENNNVQPTDVPDLEPDEEHRAELPPGLPDMPTGQENSDLLPAAGDEGTPDIQQWKGAGDAKADERQWGNGESPAPPRDAFGAPDPGKQFPPQ